MKKYQLFSEYNSICVYGENLADAITRRGDLPTPSTFENNIVIKGEPMIIGRVIGCENVSTCKRGDKKIERLLVEDLSGKIHTIDAFELDMELVEVA